MPLEQPSFTAAKNLFSLALAKDMFEMLLFLCGKNPEFAQDFEQLVSKWSARMTPEEKKQFGNFIDFTAEKKQAEFQRITAEFQKQKT